MKKILEHINILHKIIKDFITVPKNFFSLLMSLPVWLIIVVSIYFKYDINIAAKIFYYVCYIGLGVFIISHLIAAYELKKLSLILCVLSIMVTLSSGSATHIMSIINIWFLVPVTLYTMFLLVYLSFIKYNTKKNMEYSLSSNTDTNFDL